MHKCSMLTDCCKTISTYRYSLATGRENSPRIGRTSCRTPQVYSRKSRLRCIAGSRYPTRYTRKLPDKKFLSTSQFDRQQPKKCRPMTWRDRPIVFTVGHNNITSFNCCIGRASEYFAPTPTPTIKVERDSQMSR